MCACVLIYVNTTFNLFKKYFKLSVLYKEMVELVVNLYLWSDIGYSETCGSFMHRVCIYALLLGCVYRSVMSRLIFSLLPHCNVCNTHR